MPPTVGIAHVVVGPQGRIVVPRDLREVFSDRQPPISVAFTLAGPGFATAHLAENWPRRGETKVLDTVPDLARRVDPAGLPGDSLRTVEASFRLVACGYLTGEIRSQWQMLLPAPVRAWVGLPAVQHPTGRRQAPGRRPVKSAKRKADKGQQALGRLIVIANFGGLELWSEEALQRELPGQLKDFDDLATKTMKALSEAEK